MAAITELSQVSSAAGGAVRGNLDTIRPADLPAPPRAALRVLEACTNPGVDASQLAAIIGTDVPLTAGILELANSAYFGVSREVATVQQAVSILGQRALKSFALCVSVRTALGPGAVHGIDTSSFWRTALHRGVACRLLAERAGADLDEAFTVGLLLDMGLLALAHARPEGAVMWEALERRDPEERYQLELETFGMCHDDAGVLMAQAWRLPESLVGAIGDHHATSDEGRSADPLRRAARGADWLAAVFGPGEPRRIIRGARALLEREWGLGAQAADDLMAATAQGAREMSGTLGLDEVGRTDFSDLLRDANLALAEENLDAQELNRRLQHALDERDALALRLEREVDRAKIVQRSLLPVPAPEERATRDCPVAGINAPARELSGDFYDYFRLADGSVYFNLADVCGKGVDAALLMAKASGLFHCLGKTIRDPCRLLAVLNAEVYETAVHGTFVSMVAGILDAASGRVKLVNAGHVPALVVTEGGRQARIPADAPPLGVLPGCQYQAREIDLSGRSLYLFSDGLTEALAPDGSMMGYDGAAALLVEAEGPVLQERLARVINRVAKEYDSSRDDVTILVVEP